MEISKSKVDAAGATLVTASLRGDPEPIEPSVVVDEWRQLHADAMEWVADLLKRRVLGIELSAKAAQRLKRKPQIVDKLQRSTTRLSQMQDIAGCRALLSDPAAVESARLRLRRKVAPWYAVTDEDDYREEGRPGTGYRAVHLKLLREGRVVEVQLRTLLQHAWAEAVERASERTGFALKAGRGPEEVIEFFRAASDAFALLDRGDPISPQMRQMLRRRHACLRGYLPPDSGPVRPAQLDPMHFATRSNNWLIIYNWREARFVNWMNLGTDAEAAATRYGEYERRYPFDAGYEVVLIGADSAETIRHTHAHYFGTTPNDLDPHGYLARILS